MGSETGNQSASESGYSSAQTQKMGSTTTKSQKVGATKPKSKSKPQKEKTSSVTTAILDLIKDGIGYYNDGNFANAMKSFKSVLKSQLIRKSQGNDPIVANMLANIGSVYLRLNRYDHAIESFEKAVRMMRRSKAITNDEPMKQKNNTQQQMIIKPTDAPLAWVLNNLGTAWCFKGDYTASLRCYWGAIDDAKTHYGESTTIEIANALYNIGRIGVLQQDYSMALGTLQKSLELETQLHGGKSIEAVDTLNLIGFVHYSTGDFDRAISIFTEALSIVTTRFGSVHEQVAVSLVNVGMVLENEEEDLEEALRCFATAQTVCEKVGLDARNRNSIMHTAIRSANDIREKIFMIQNNKNNVGLLSKRTKGNNRVASTTEQQDSREPSVHHNRKPHTTRDAPDCNDPSYELRSRGKTNNMTHAMPNHPTKKTFSSDTPTAAPPTPTPTRDPSLDVRRDGKEVDVQTYAAYKDRLKSEQAMVEYREDPYWEYDDSSMVEEERDESE